jgi:hypothetical protein
MAKGEDANRARSSQPGIGSEGTTGRASYVGSWIRTSMSYGE